jgi:hypothetical protein
MIRANRLLIIILIVSFQAMLVSYIPQEARVNQKKIERERAKKQKQARKDYDQAVKHHNKIQSKSTRASMKKTKKESKKSTPTKR